jgi:signal transduction histidine kinase
VKFIPSESPETPAESSPDSVRDRTPFSMPEVRIAVTYVLLASIWIIGSDTVLNLFVNGQPDTVFFQSFKGLNFVITTGVVLFFVLRRAYGGWRCSEERRMATLRSARERYRNLSSKLQTMREEERTRISREIHDELGQLLTGIKMRLRLIEDHLANRDDRSLNPAIDDLVETSAMIDETIHSVRRISSGLRPLALDHLGLAAALDEEAEQFSKRTGIECRLKIGDMEESIRPEVQTAAFRIFQEALTNVARHAEARGIDAECSTRDGVLNLTVSDDGVGIAPDAAGNQESLGLMGMLERAADVGGKVEFASPSGRGTKVALTIPLAV